MLLTVICISTSISISSLRLGSSMVTSGFSVGVPSFPPSAAAMLAHFDSVGSSSNDPRLPLMFSAFS